MSMADNFKSFCEEICLDNLAEMQTSAGEIAKKLNKHYYDIDKDSEFHLYVVGSVGRHTAIKGSSDLDILFDLPDSVYKKYNAYESNGQSQLLQDVKTVLKERYPNTKIRGDGQVVVIEFTKFTVELVPGFKQSDNRFKYPDTHDGGSWKTTDPLSEQDECEACNSESGGVYYDFCHMMRSWKNNIGFAFGGLLIDTLVYNHFVANDYYADASYDDYLTILDNLFEYLKGLDKNQSYWFAVGSNQKVYNSNNGVFVTKAKSAYDELNSAIKKSEGIDTVLQKLFGSEQFSTPENRVLKEFSQYSYRNTEEFIEHMLSVDIRYSLQIDCKVSQDGWRDFFLLQFLRSGGGWLSRNKKLDFFIKSTDCPPPYSIYWKVRNIGSEAERRDCIRGQVSLTNRDHHNERTSFFGPHYVECYLVKNNVCVARSRIDVPISSC